MRILVLLLCLCWASASAQLNLQYKENKTITYPDLIQAYSYLADKYESAHLVSYGKTDVGRNLQLFVLSNTGLDKSTMKDKAVLLINNGIHAGEPCGVDASLQFAMDVLNGKEKVDLDKVVVCIIPGYNVGGLLNRGQSRVNQNGPEEYGFRGNYQHLDLNRDFIKMDSKNAEAFVSIFQEWMPDVFIDTHTTNGSQYQYTLSLISGQLNKLNPKVAEPLREQMLPAIFDNMKKRGCEITPYVYSLEKTPDHGIKDFLDSPRYSSGYAALFHTIGFISEAHKFKPFADRVHHTHQLIETIVQYTVQHGKEIKKARAAAFASDKKKELFPVLWELDKSNKEELEFKGYAYDYKTSDLTGQKKLAYDMNSPKTYKIDFFNRYKPIAFEQVPAHYYIPQCYDGVIKRLRFNKVAVTRLDKDTLMMVDAYRIKDYETPKKPYEKHYLHSGIQVENGREQVQLFKGDYVVSTDQKHRRFIVETLCPVAHDSYFVWNFFDNVLQQKEWFSDYAFEETAAKTLQTNTKLRESFELKKKTDSAFAGSGFNQLYYIFEHGGFMEPSFNRYPVYRSVK